MNKIQRLAFLILAAAVLLQGATILSLNKRVTIAERAQVDQDIQLRELRTNLNEFIPAATNAIVANKKSIDQIAAKVFPQPKAKPAKQKAKP